jgi:hypothetical protein
MEKGKGVTFNPLVEIHVFEDDTVREKFSRTERSFKSSQRRSLKMGFPRGLIFGGKRRPFENPCAASLAHNSAMELLNSNVADIVFGLFKDPLGPLNEVNPRLAYIWLLNKLREVVAKLVDGDVAWLQENATDFYRYLHSDGEYECATPLQVAAFVMDKLPK